MKKGYLGIDVGSVSTNLIVIDEMTRYWHLCISELRGSRFGLSKRA